MAGVLGAAEAALSQFSQHRLHALVEEGRRDLRPLQDRSRVLTAVLTARAMVLLLTGSLVTTFAYRMEPTAWSLAAALGAAAALVMLAEVLGRVLTIRRPE